MILGLWLLLLGSPPVAKGGIAVTLDPIPGETGEFNFGTSRDPRTHTLVFAVNPPLPYGIRIIPVRTDLHSGGDVFPARDIKVGRRLSTDRSRLKVQVTLNPDRVAPGGYEGQLTLATPGGSVRMIPLTAKVRARIWNGPVTFAIAFTAILAGVIFGGVLKWLSDTGSHMHSLQTRIQYIRTLIGGTKMPTAFENELDGIQVRLDERDVKGAQDGLEKILPDVHTAFEEAVALESLRRDLASQRTLVDAMKLQKPEDTMALKSVIDREEFEIERALEALWSSKGKTGGRGPKPKATAAKVELADRINAYTRFLVLYSYPDQRTRLQPALLHFIAGRLKEAIDAIDHARSARTIQTTGEHQMAAETVAAALPAALAAVTGDGREARSLEVLGRFLRSLAHPLKPIRAIRRLAVAHYDLAATAITAIAVSTLGMTLVYYGSDTFGSPLDWLKLVLWGFGAQVTGATITQLGGKALSAGPRLEDRV